LTSSPVSDVEDEEKVDQSLIQESHINVNGLDMKGYREDGEYYEELPEPYAPREEYVVYQRPRSAPKAKGYLHPTYAYA
jgi:hypothetical protein